MSVSVSVPEELYRKVVEIADAHHLSVGEVFASAYAEHAAAWERLQHYRHAATAKVSRRSRQGA